MRVAVITISDSVAAGKYEDRSGPSVKARCAELGWAVVSSSVLPDDRDAIAQLLKKIAGSRQADLILTTGGTGVGPRDVTPEATLIVAERLIPGFAEHMRSEGVRGTKRALLSRGVAVILGEVIVINLPGSPKGAVESLDFIADLLPHALDVLHGSRH